MINLKYRKYYDDCDTHKSHIKDIFKSKKNIKIKFICD